MCQLYPSNKVHGAPSQCANITHDDMWQVSPCVACSRPISQSPNMSQCDNCKNRRICMKKKRDVPSKECIYVSSKGLECVQSINTSSWECPRSSTPIFMPHHHHVLHELTCVHASPMCDQLKPVSLKYVKTVARSERDHHQLTTIMPPIISIYDIAKRPREEIQCSTQKEDDITTRVKAGRKVCVKVVLLLGHSILWVLLQGGWIANDHPRPKHLVQSC